MDVQNYNVALAKNREDYQSKYNQNKTETDSELKSKEGHYNRNLESLKKEKINQKQDLDRDYSQKIKENHDKLNSLLEKRDEEYNQNLESEITKHRLEAQELRDNQKRELEKIQMSYEGSKESIPRDQLDAIERKLKNTEKYHIDTVSKITEEDSKKIDTLHQDFNKAKEQLVKEKEDTIDMKSTEMRKAYSESTNKKENEYEERIRAKTIENEELLFRLNTLSKKLGDKFTRVLNNRLDEKDHLLEQERIEMKKMLEDRELQNAIKLDNQRREFEAKMHEISLRNDKKVEDITSRNLAQISELNNNHEKEFKEKVRELNTTITNLKASQELEITGIKDYYDHRLRRLNEKVSDAQGVGVRVVSK